MASGGSPRARPSTRRRATNYRADAPGNNSRTECPTMPARNIKTYIAAVAAAAAVGLGAPAAASAGFIAAPVSALASGPGGDASQAPMRDLQLTQHTPRRPARLLGRRGAIGRPMRDRHRVRADRGLIGKRSHLEATVDEPAGQGPLG